VQEISNAEKFLLAISYIHWKIEYAVPNFITMNFEYKSFPNHVYFGAGKISVLDELLKGYETIMVVASERMQQHVDHLISTFGENKIIHFSKIIQQVPVELVQEAHEILVARKPNVLLAIGGGSAIGLAKALALETSLPIYAVPSTYAGSEQTNIWGTTSQGVKTTGRADVVLPRVVIYDSNLTVKMPKLLAVTSAMNAMAHLMEAIYSPSGNPVTRHNSVLGMKEIKEGLEDLANVSELTSEANEKILFGAYLAGKSLCEVPMSLHHKAAHVLGGSFGMDHASVHTVLQPYVLAYQWPHLSEDVKADFVNTLGGENPPLILKNLASNAGAKTDLKSIGFKKEDIDAAAGLIISNPYANPAPLTKEGMVSILTNAFDGTLS
jgi:alcohol dehydrogenase class IV